MNFNAYGLIMDMLMEELEKQGFRAPAPIEWEEGRAEMMATEDVAYGLFYNKKQQRFELKSTTLDDDDNPTAWRSLSLWLFDEAEGTREDANSIANDFLEIVQGPKRVAVVQQKKKRGKNDERNIDPLFFINRLANIFPELKEDLKEERITYGQVRYATFLKEKATPKCQELALRYKDSELTEKLSTLFSDMYADGDMDLRSLLTISLLNNMSEEGFLNIREKLSDELQTDTKYTRKLIGKNIKPEKKKKEKKVQARLE